MARTGQVRVDDRRILRFPEPANTNKHTGNPKSQPQACGPGRRIQRTRFQATFDRVAQAFEDTDPEFVLRQDPAGIAPERALVFVTAGRIQRFARVAQEIGLEVFAETDLEAIEDYPDGFEPAGETLALSRVLYATMPTVESIGALLSLWKAYQNEEQPPHGARPWWTLFDLMLELRPWGPEDRLSDGARAAIEERLSIDDSDEVAIEFEICPTLRNAQRVAGRAATEQRIVETGGRVLDRSSISGDRFVYEALLATVPVGVVRTMLDDRHHPESLATIEDVQFILPQTRGQASPVDIVTDGETRKHDPMTKFGPEAPIRAALFDGTPVAGHAALDGGVLIEDVHDLVRLSPVDQRYHATAMASLILRGDLNADGVGLLDARVVSVPLLIDSENGANSPSDRLFVDMLHTALLKLFTGDEPLAPEAFVVNFSIGLGDLRFSGRISAVARLLDWWAAKEGVLFVISAGNIREDLWIKGTDALAFECANQDERRDLVRTSLQGHAYERTLLAPAECLNGISVGALSIDLGDHRPPPQAGVLDLGDPTEPEPHITSALGLGPHRTIKPDLLATGGRQEVRALPSGNDTRLRPVVGSGRTGLGVAAPTGSLRTKSSGTSPAAALTTRAVLRCAELLTGERGPYEGQALSRRDLALLTRALAVNSAYWPEGAHRRYEQELDRLGKHQHARAKEEVCRHFGHGVLDLDLMQRSPETGVTLVGLGSVRKDGAQIFRMPLPPSLSGDRVPRSMRVTLAWFSPLDPARAQYRLAGLEAVPVDEEGTAPDQKWGLALKSSGPDANMVRRGSVWSRRLIHGANTVPSYDDPGAIPIRVQCRDTAGGALNPDEEIAYAIVVTLAIEADVEYDVYAEVEAQIRVRLSGA